MGLSVGELLTARTPAGRDASQEGVCAMTDTPKRLERGEVLARKQTQGHMPGGREENLGQHRALSLCAQLTQADGAQRPPATQGGLPGPPSRWATDPSGPADWTLVGPLSSLASVSVPPGDTVSLSSDGKQVISLSARARPSRGNTPDLCRGEVPAGSSANPAHGPSRSGDCVSILCPLSQQESPRRLCCAVKA